MTWDIQSFSRVGAVSFAMSAAQVAAATGLPAPTLRHDGPYVSEFRGVQARVFNYLDDKLALVSLSRYLPDVEWNGMNVFRSPAVDVLRALYVANGPALRIFETLVFSKFGLQLTGFYVFERGEAFDIASDDPDNRVVSAWTRAALERNLTDLASHIEPAPEL
jgi:hypothetical protein